MTNANGTQSTMYLFRFFLFTWTQIKNFFTMVGDTLEKWPGVATDASKTYTSPATPTCSSFNRISPAINTNFMQSSMFGVLISLLIPRKTQTRRPFGVSPGKIGPCLNETTQKYCHLQVLKPIKCSMVTYTTLKISANSGRSTSRLAKNSGTALRIV